MCECRALSESVVNVEAQVVLGAFASRWSVVVELLSDAQLPVCIELVVKLSGGNEGAAKQQAVGQRAGLAEHVLAASSDFEGRAQHTRGVVLLEGVAGLISVSEVLVTRVLLEAAELGALPKLRVLEPVAGVLGIAVDNLSGEVFHADLGVLHVAGQVLEASADHPLLLIVELGVELDQDFGLFVVLSGNLKRYSYLSRSPRKSCQGKCDLRSR